MGRPRLPYWLPSWLRAERLLVRLLLFVLLPLTTTIAAAGLWLLNALEAQLEHRLQGEVEMVARALQLPLSRALQRSGTSAVQTALDSAFAIGRVYGAYVYDERGDLIASSAARKPNEQALRAGQLVQDGERAGQYDDVDGRQVYSYFVPLSGSGSEPLGLLRVTRKKSNVENYLSDLRLKGLAWIALFALGLTSLVLGGHYAAVGRSLRRFAHSIHRVTSGAHQHRASIERPREIADLVQSFNAMLDSLALAEQRIADEYRQRAALERQLRESERLAILGGMAAGVAHELGTPLSTVGGYAQRVLRRPQLEPEVRESLEVVRGQVSRMERLVRQLLEYGVGRQRQRGVLEAGDLISSACDALAAAADQARVDLAGEPAHGVFVCVDRLRFEQALINLVQNAVQAAQQRVRVGCETRDGLVLFIVDDDGPGVSPQLRARVYEAFVTSRQAQGGTGLGLAISARVAEEHDGVLYDTPSPLGGARFVLAVGQQSMTTAAELEEV